MGCASSSPDPDSDSDSDSNSDAAFTVVGKRLHAFVDVGHIRVNGVHVELGDAAIGDRIITRQVTVANDLRIFAVTLVLTDEEDHYIIGGESCKVSY